MVSRNREEQAASAMKKRVLQLPSKITLSMSRQILPPSSMFGWYTGVVNLVVGSRMTL